MNLSIVIPCWNEEENVELLVERLRAAVETDERLGMESTELILVDDGSSDATWEKIDACAQNDNFVRGVRHATNGGIASGWASGADAARGRYILTMDADLQYRPEDVPRLYDCAIDTDADLVQGCRVSQVAPGFFRTLLSKGLSGLLNAMLGLRLKDAKSGFVCYRADAFRAILEDREHFRCFQHFITASAAARGFSIRQVPVVFDSRHAGESFIQSPTQFSINAARDLPFALRFYAFGRKRFLRAPLHSTGEAESSH